MSLFSGLEIETDKAFRVLLNDPDGNPLLDESDKQGWIDVISTDSKTAERAQRARRDKMISGQKLTAETSDRAGAEILAQLTTGWYLVGLNRKPLDAPFSIENAQTLYLNSAASYITEQVRSAAATRSHFMPAPASS